MHPLPHGSSHLTGACHLGTPSLIPSPPHPLTPTPPHPQYLLSLGLGPADLAFMLLRHPPAFNRSVDDLQQVGGWRGLRGARAAACLPRTMGAVPACPNAL